MIRAEKNFHDDIPSFMTGFGTQQYHIAEEGILYAYQQGCTHWYIDGAIHHDRAITWDDKRIRGLNQLVEQYAVRPIYHGSFKNPIASDVPELRQAALEYLKKEIDVSAAISAPLIIHAGGVVEPRQVKEVKQRSLDGFIDSMSIALEYAKNSGVDIWLENLCNYKKFHPFYYIMTNIEEYRYVLNALPDAMMIFDVCHETVGGGDPISTFNELSDRICAFSFSDTQGVKDTHSPLGRGIINYKRLLELIEQKNWRGTVAFETRGVEAHANIDYLNKIMADIKNQPTTQAEALIA